MPRPKYRLQHSAAVLAAIQEGRYSGAELRLHLGLTPRTLARVITDLRAAGHRIVAVRDGMAWYYRVESADVLSSNGEKP